MTYVQIKKRLKEVANLLKTAKGLEVLRLMEEAMLLIQDLEELESTLD